MAMQQYNLDFTLVNRTGFQIYKVFVSAADDDSWESDVMGAGVLMPNTQVFIDFARESAQPLWDLKIDDSAGNEYYWRGLHLGSISKITLYWDGENTSAETE